MATERRVLGLWYVVFVNVAAIFSLRTLTDVARFGWGALALTLAAFAVFFVPLTMAVVSLSARYPEEGGLYRWTYTAYGPGHAFVCGWSYFVTNLVYFPAVLTHVAAVVPWLVWGRTDAIAQSPAYVLVIGLAGLWGVGVLPNVLGARRAAQLSGAGVAGSLAGTAILVGLAGLAAGSGAGSATPASTWIPSLGADPIAMLALLSSFAFMFAGLELAPTMGGEVRDARRTLVRGALISGAVVTLLFVVTLSAIVLGLRPDEIALADGIPAAVGALAARLGAPLVVVRAVALCLVVAAMGAIVVWMAGSARLVRAAGVDRAMPAWFGREHPRLGTPVGALVAQGAMASVLLVASVAGSTVREAYATLRSVTQVTYFVPFLYLFASHARLAADGSRVRALASGGLGFATTLAGVAAAVLPPADIDNVAVFEIKVIGGSALLILAGAPLYLSARPRIE